MNQSTRLGATLKEGMKTPVVVATTLNIALQGLPLISGVQLVARDRVLVKSQNNKAENGIYVVATGTWDRDKDFNASNDVVNGQLVIDSNSGLLYRVNFTGEIDLGVTLLSFFVADPDSRSKQVDTLADWQNDTSAQLGDVVTTAERTAGNGGGGTGEVIASGTETGFKIVKHSTLPLSWELRDTDTVDIRQMGANGGDDALAIQAAADLARDNKVKLVGFNLSSTITSDITIYTDTDLSSCTFTLVSPAQILVKDDRSEAVFKKTLLEADLVMASMTENASILPVVDTGILETFKDSAIKITSNEVDIIRNNGGVWTDQLKGGVSHLSEYGQLSYTLNGDYTATGQGIEVELRKLPEKRIRVKLPFIDATGFNSGFAPMIAIQRDLVTVSGFSFSENIKDNNTNANGVLEIQSFGCQLFEAHTPGRGIFDKVNDSEPNLVAYDILTVFACKTVISALTSNQSWKTIDGNYSRDTIVENCLIYGYHGHWACSDITVKNCSIRGRGLSFGGGAFDSIITIKGGTIFGTERSMVQIRSDFGELKGELIIKDLYWDIDNGYRTDDFTEFFLLDLAEANVKGSIAAGFPQPRKLFAPNKVTITNIKVNSSFDYHLINKKNVDYQETPGEDYKTTKVIRIDGIRNNLPCETFFFHGVRDTDNTIPDIEIKDIDRLVFLKLGSSDAVSDVSGISNQIFRGEKAFFRSGKNTTDKIFGGTASKNVFYDAKISSQWDHFDALIGSYKGQSYYNNVTFVVDSTLVMTEFTIDGKWIEIHNCIMDGRQSRIDNAVNASSNITANAASGNSSWDFDSPRTLKFQNSAGRQGVFPDFWERNAFEFVTIDFDSPTPRWDTNQLPELATQAPDNSWFFPTVDNAGNPTWVKITGT